MSKPKTVQRSLSKSSVRTLVELQRRIQEKRAYRPRPETGHAYVIGFDSGVVKVGITANPGQRFATLKRQAIAHGNRVADARLSWIHADYVETERKLVAFCKANGEARGREFFLVPFPAVAEFALTIPYFDIARYDAAIQRMAERDERRREYLNRLIAAANGDMDMTWAEAHSRLGETDLIGGA